MIDRNYAADPLSKNMSLAELLLQGKGSILKRWLNLIEESRPSGNAPFTRSNDELTNPEGFITHREVEALFHELLQNELNFEKVCISLDNIVRIKAVQDLSPAQTIAFVFLLKEAIVSELQSEIEKRQLLGEWLALELKIDMLASLSFDAYMQCREKINQLRFNEVKADRERAFRMLELVESGGRKIVKAAE